MLLLFEGCRTLKPGKNPSKPIRNDPRPLEKSPDHSKKYTVLKSGRTEVLLDTQDQLSRLALVQTPTSADNVLSQKAGDKPNTPRTVKVHPCINSIDEY